MRRLVLVTGAAGFIGFHVAARLLAEGRDVVGVDSFTPYYDPALKEARFARLLATPGFIGRRLDLAEAGAVGALFAEFGFGRVVHLAAQPGVRHGLDHAADYGPANLVAFLNILEASRHAGLDHLVFASSSSVYGASRRLPFTEDDPVDAPLSLYAATKRANELMARSYAHLFGLPTTGLRFFTVYGPWGRPDMAVYAFTDAIASGRPIRVAEGGTVKRDFTFIDDVAESVVRLLDKPPSGEPPFDLLNVGGDRPTELTAMLSHIETSLGRRAERTSVPLPPGDMTETRACTRLLADRIGYVPETDLADGIARFVRWYLEYKNIIL